VPPGEAAHFFSAGAWRRNGKTGQDHAQRKRVILKRPLVVGQGHAQTKTFDGRNWS